MFRCIHRKSKAHRGPAHHHDDDDNDLKAEAGVANIAMEGEYCTINEAKVARRASRDANADQSGDTRPPAYEETTLAVRTHAGYDADRRCHGEGEADHRWRSQLAPRAGPPLLSFNLLFL